MTVPNQRDTKARVFPPADGERIVSARPGLPRPPKARYIEVIEVVFLRGQGIAPDPVRQVTAYYAADGTFLAEADPCVGGLPGGSPTDD